MKYLYYEQFPDLGVTYWSSNTFKLLFRGFGLFGFVCTFFCLKIETFTRSPLLAIFVIALRVAHLRNRFYNPAYVDRSQNGPIDHDNIIGQKLPILQQYLYYISELMLSK
jgi:hypothetical protein